MRAFRLAVFFAVGLILGGGSVAAFAGNPTVWVSPGAMIWRAPNGTVQTLSNPTWGGVASLPGSVEAKLKQSARLAGGGILDVDIVRSIPNNKVAQVGVKLARLGGPAAIGLTLGSLVWDMANGWQIADGPTDLTGKQACKEAAGISGNGGYAPECDHAQSATLAWYRVGTEGPWAASQGGTCNAVKTASWLYTARGYDPSTCQQLGELRPATDAEIQQQIVAQGVQLDKMSDVAQRLINSGFESELANEAEPIQTTGPQTIQGGQETTTQTTPQGTTTTTKTTTHNVTYNNNVVNITTNITTTVTNPDGTQTTTQEQKQGPQDGREQEEKQYTLDYSKPQGLEVPDFYEQQYPDGFAGEWDRFRDRVSASSLASFIGSLTNGIPGGGECPSWSVGVNMGAMGNFGTHTIAPPCIIWPFIKAVMILSALFVARRMVVGG